jgi:hypothetical protein
MKRLLCSQDEPIKGSGGYIKVLYAKALFPAFLASSA